MPRLSSLERGRAIGQLQAGVNNSTWQDGSDDRWRQLKFPSLYRRDIATSGCSLRPEHGARGIVPGWQLPTPSSQDRGRVPAAGTNHEGGLAGLLTGLKPYWACLGSVGKSSTHAPERGQHTCCPPEVSVGIVYHRTIFSVWSTACAADVQNVLLPVVVPPIIDVLWQ